MKKLNKEFMSNINRRIALVVFAIGLLLFAAVAFTSAWQQPWFVFVIALWGFIFCSACYRLTPFFKNRNPISEFLKRDTSHIFAFSLNGFFDSKNGPHWLVIDRINSIEIKDNYLCFYNHDESEFAVNLPASDTELEQFIKRFFTHKELQAITLR